MVSVLDSGAEWSGFGSLPKCINGYRGNAGGNFAMH